MNTPLISIVGMVVILGVVSDASAQKVKPTSCGADVALSVTVSGSQTAPGGYGLVSDGLGTYRSEARGARVTAIFQVTNCTHDFTINFSQSSRIVWALLAGGDTEAWFFNFDRAHSVPVTTGANFLTSKFCTDGVAYGADGKIAKNSEGDYQDNYAGCAVDEQGVAFVRRHGGGSLDGDEKLSFQRSGIDQPAQSCAAIPNDPNCSSSFLRVYRPDAVTWVVRTEPAAIAAHRVWGGGNQGYVFVGYETLPLEWVITKQ